MGAVLTPACSLLPAVIALIVVQSLTPATQRVPTGPARFDLAGAWLATEPGALAGTSSWLTAPTLGRLQLGLLIRLLQGGEAQSVLAAAHGAMLVLAVVQAVLLWWVLRRLGAGGVAAGLATAVFGVAPIAVETHAAIAAAAVGAVWLLLAAGLVLGRRRASLAAGGAAAAIGVASVPTLVVAVAALAVLLVLRLRREARGAGVSWFRALRPAGAGFVVAAVLLGAAMAVLAALPRGSASTALAELVAAQGSAPMLGAAALARWAQTDLLSLLVAAGAVLLTALGARDRPVTVLVVVVGVLSFWPQGEDPTAPLVALLAVVAAAVARSVDVGVIALGHPTFVRSVLGSAWLTGVAALLVVAVLGWLVGLSGLVRGSDQAVAKVERWIDSSVPAGQTVLVGLGSWPDIARSTDAEVGWYAAGTASRALPSSIPWSRADYVVTDASLPLDVSGAAGASGAAATVLGRSLQVASFGAGDTAMTVRAVRAVEPEATPEAPTTAAGRAAARLRASVGTQLAENPRVEVTGQDRARLLAGDVDTRIALVLAQFVTTHRVAISGFGLASGDTSGIRTTVTVREIDGRGVPADGTKTGVLLRFLSDLSGEFAPASIDATNSGITAAFTPRAPEE